MVLKLEYCAKILKALHPGIVIMFLFYNYYKKYRGREYRLNVTKTNIGYGGSQPAMHSKNINQEVGFLVTH